MKKSTKKPQRLDLRQYIYIRLGEDVKNDVKKAAEREGLNMTSWVRQLVIKTLRESQESQG